MFSIADMWTYMRARLLGWVARSSEIGVGAGLVANLARPDGNLGKDDGHRAGFPLQRRRSGKNDARLQYHQRGRVGARSLRVALRPACSRRTLRPSLRPKIASSCRKAAKRAFAPDHPPLGPAARRRSASLSAAARASPAATQPPAESSRELPAPHSITSSARARSVAGLPPGDGREKRAHHRSDELRDLSRDWATRRQPNGESTSFPRSAQALPC